MPTKIINSHHSGDIAPGQTGCYKNRKELLPVSNSSIQYLSKAVTIPEFLKIPCNFEGIPYKLQRLYIKYLDCKAQTTEGVFRNPGTRKWSPSVRQYYRRAMQDIQGKGWATAKDGNISLRAYQFVWRDLKVERFQKWDKKKFKDQSRTSSGEFYCYFKVWVSELKEDRKSYYEQIRQIIHKEIANRKRAQLKWRLNKTGTRIDEATFSAKSAALLFGYSSRATGSKLRKKNFSMLPSGKAFFNQKKGRWEDPPGRIAL